MVQQLSVLAMLGICSLDDIRQKKIQIGWMICFTAEGLLCRIFLWQTPFMEILVSMVPGAVMLAFAYISRGGIGEGDGLLLITAGIFLGAECVLRILMYAVFFSAGYALFLYIVQKKSRKYEIPFVPFLLIAFVGDLI